MIQIEKGLPLPIENSFRSVVAEVRKLSKKVEDIDTGATEAALNSLSREVARLTRKDNDESYLDFWAFHLGDIGLGKDITLGTQLNMYVPIPVRITGYTLIGDATGSLELALSTIPYSDFGVGTPTNINGSEAPTLASSQTNQNLTIATWIQNVAAGSVLFIDAVNASAIMQATLVLNIRRM